MPNLVRSSRHTIRFANPGKRERYAAFVSEYRRVASLLLDRLWDNGWELETDGESHVLDIPNDRLDHPRMLDKRINDAVGETSLSARALKCCSTQVCGVLGAVLERRRRILWAIGKAKSEGNPPWRLERRFQPLVKPSVESLNPELNSICCDFSGGTAFGGFLQLKCLGKRFGRIRIPIRFHRSSDRWMNKGKMMPSFLLGKDSVSIRWDVEKPKPRMEGGDCRNRPGVENRRHDEQWSRH